MIEGSLVQRASLGDTEPCIPCLSFVRYSTVCRITAERVGTQVVQTLQPIDRVLQHIIELHPTHTFHAVPPFPKEIEEHIVLLAATQQQHLSASLTPLADTEQRFSIFAVRRRSTNATLEVPKQTASDNESGSDDESCSAIDAEVQLRKYVEPFNHAVMMVRAAYFELFTVLFLDKDDEMSMELLSQYDADIWFDYEDESITTFTEDDNSEAPAPPLSLMRVLVAELESAAAQVCMDGAASVRPEVFTYLRTALMPVVIAYLSMRQTWATGDSRIARAKRLLVARLIVAVQVIPRVIIAHVLRAVLRAQPFAIKPQWAYP